MRLTYPCLQARGFLREADKKEAEGEAFAGPSKLAAETYQSLFEQVRKRERERESRDDDSSGRLS